MDGDHSFSAFIPVVLLHCLFSYSSAGFIETPSMRNMLENDLHNEKIMLRCRHMRLDADITWLINGTHSRLHPGVIDDSTLESDGTFVETLTIPTIQKYNGIEVVCLARFVDGSPEERSPPVTLITITAYGKGILTDVSASTSPQPDTDPTSPISTTSSTKLVYTTSTTANFKITPDPLTVAVEEGTATFYCQHSSSDAVNWLVNGTSLKRIESHDITATTFTDVDTITFQTLLEFHQTTVECVATFFDSSPSQFSSPVTLLIQDTPGPVNNASCTRNYSSNILITSWDSLPSLDINNTDPDIVYGVELYKITCGRDIFVNYEVAITNYISNTIDPYQIYKAVISPMNNVEGTRNGTSKKMEEKFMSVQDILFQLTRKPHIIIEDETPVPSYYTVTLKSLDGFWKGFHTTMINVTREGNYVTLSMDGTLPPQTLWNVSVHAYNCTTDGMEEDIELSTHDVQNVSVSSTHSGDIRVTGDIIDGSTVTGVLVIVYSHSDVHYITSSPADHKQNINITVTGLTGSNYGVSTFSMENGLIFPRVVALPRTVDMDITNRQAKQTSLVEYTLKPTSNGVCINCAFLDSSATDCVAVVHQQISQLNSGGLMNIKSSHKFTRSGDTASGCIERVNLEDYQVGVIGGRELNPIVARTKEGAAVCSGCSAGAVLVVVFFIALAVIVVIITLAICRRRTKLPQEHTESGLFSPDSLTVNSPTVCHQYEECPQNLTDRNQEVTDVQGSSDSLDSSDMDNPPPLPPRLEEPFIPMDQTPLEPNMVSPNSPTTTETDVYSGSSSASVNDDDLGDPTYDQPVFTKTSKSTSANMHSSLCADHNMTGAEDGDETLVQSADGPMYTQPQLTTSSTVQCPPAADNVVYDQVNEFKNSEGQHYVMLSDMPTSMMTPDGHQKMEYAVITQQPSKPISDEGVGQDEDLNECSKKKEKITEDQAFHTLIQYSSQWQSLGEALSLDEDHLDEIFTNNETNEVCLQEMLGLYFKRSDLEHSWEVIDAALKRIEDKLCTTESDMYHQPQPCIGLLEKTVDKPLKQMETSGGGPLLINKMSETSSVIKDVSEKERVHERQEGESDVDDKVWNQDIQDFTSVHDIPFSVQGGDNSNDDVAIRIISNIKSPSDKHLDGKGTAMDEIFVGQSLVDDFSPLVFPCDWDPMARDPEQVIAQASGEHETDYNTAMKKLLRLTSGSKIRNLLTHHNTKLLQSSTNLIHPPVDNELALDWSRMTVSSTNTLFHLCGLCAKEQVMKVGYQHCNQLVDSHSSSYNDSIPSRELSYQVH